MSNRWRIVNPSLVPAQVIAESGDEQAILRQCATRDPSDGLKLLKSEDDGTTWVEVEARKPDAVSEWKPPAEEPLKGIKAAPPTVAPELPPSSPRSSPVSDFSAPEHAETRTKHRK